MKNILCRFGIHIWTRFEYPTLTFGGHSIQERHCKCCNLVDRRMVVIRVPGYARTDSRDGYPPIDGSGR